MSDGDCDHPTEVCTEGMCHMCGWVYDPQAPERKAEAVDVVAEFLHTGGPSLNADQAAIEIVGVLSRAGFLDRKDTQP